MYGFSEDFKFMAPASAPVPATRRMRTGDGVLGGSEASPIGFPKQAAPSLNSLGITSGSQIGILFDGVQPQSGNNNVVNINDLTLKLYSGSMLLYQVSGTFSNLATNPGNGQSDYLFTLDPSAVNAFNAVLGGNTNDFIALDSSSAFPIGVQDLTASASSIDTLGVVFEFPFNQGIALTKSPVAVPGRINKGIGSVRATDANVKTYPWAFSP